MNSLAYYPVKAKWRANTIYLCPPANTAGAKYATGLGLPAPGTKWGHNSGERLAAGIAKKITFLPTADTPLWE